jgi:hypothetical protein
MIVKPALAAMLASGLIVPEKPALVFPKPAIVKAENLEFSKHLLLGMPMTMGMLKGGSSAPPITVIGRASIKALGTALTTYSFGEMPLGGTSPTRYVLAYVFGESDTATSRTISSVKINNVTATIHATGFRVGGNGIIRAAIAGVLAPLYDAPGVVVTFSGAMNRAGAFIVGIDGLISDVAYDTITAATQTSGVTYSNVIDWKAGGYVMGGLTASEQGSHFWTGLNEVSEGNWGTADASWADLLPTTDATGQLVQAGTSINNPSRVTLLAASFR